MPDNYYGGRKWSLLHLHTTPRTRPALDPRLDTSCLLICTKADGEKKPRDKYAKLSVVAGLQHRPEQAITSIQPECNSGEQCEPSHGCSMRLISPLDSTVYKRCSTHALRPVSLRFILIHLTTSTFASTLRAQDTPSLPIPHILFLEAFIHHACW